MTVDVLELNLSKVKPILTLKRSAKPSKRLIEQLEAAGYLVVLVTYHDDIRLVDPTGDTAGNLLDCALRGIRTATYKGNASAEWEFHRNVSMLALDERWVKAKPA